MEHPTGQLKIELKKKQLNVLTLRAGQMHGDWWQTLQCSLHHGIQSPLQDKVPAQLYNYNSKAGAKLLTKHAFP